MHVLSRRKLGSRDLQEDQNRAQKYKNKLDRNKGKASDNLAESLIAGNFVSKKASVKFIYENS